MSPRAPSHFPPHSINYNSIERLDFVLAKSFVLLNLYINIVHKLDIYFIQMNETMMQWVNGTVLVFGVVSSSLHAKGIRGPSTTHIVLLEVNNYGGNISPLMMFNSVCVLQLHWDVMQSMPRTQPNRSADEPDNDKDDEATTVRHNSIAHSPEPLPCTAFSRYILWSEEQMHLIVTQLVLNICEMILYSTQTTRNIIQKQDGYMVVFGAEMGTGKELFSIWGKALRMYANYIVSSGQLGLSLCRFQHNSVSAFEWYGVRAGWFLFIFEPGLSALQCH